MSTNTTSVEQSGISMENPVLNDSQIAADPTLAAVQPATNLPSLSDMPSVESPDQIVKKVIDETAAKKQWLRQAAILAVKYDTTLETLSAVVKTDEDADIADTYQSQRDAAERGLKRLNDLPPEMQERLGFAKFMELLKQCNPADKGKIQGFIDSIVTCGRYRILTSEEFQKARNEPRGISPYAISFQGKYYLPTIFEDPAPGQRALEIEITKLVMKARGAGHSTDDLLAGKEGLYYLHIPRSQRDQCDGHALVKVFFHPWDEEKIPQVKVLTAIGNVVALAKIKLGRTAVPLAWIKDGHVLSKRRLEQDDFDRALFIIRRLRSALSLARPEPILRS